VLTIAGKTLADATDRSRQMSTRCIAVCLVCPPLPRLLAKLTIRFEDCVPANASGSACRSVA
jgi:hypothetical protein